VGDRVKFTPVSFKPFPSSEKNFIRNITNSDYFFQQKISLEFPDFQANTLALERNLLE
jgi:hypothetical protein